MNYPAKDELVVVELNNKRWNVLWRFYKRSKNKISFR
jgi:hypothetical protein